MTGLSESTWLALAIGNSRLHWAWFEDDALKQTWDTPHLSIEAIATLTAPSLHFSPSNELPENLQNAVPPQLASLLGQQPLLLIASVVPNQTTFWQSYPRTWTIRLDHIPLRGTYPTLGIDRALAVWAATTIWNLPALVIDAGTALTFTGANEGQLIGGAILPGLQLQLRSLTQTAALPFLDSQIAAPTRWATGTADAIYSGILYTLLAGIRDFAEDWLEKFPESAIALTGGDSTLLFTHLQQRFPNLATHIDVAPALIFQGMQAVKRQHL
ncbi:pantothenate kinase [Leptolyngbya sp. FACHB-541]|uniref:pantothenate kinase n=1 Tax=Leptolyngbya sp. FACHB-541 TaxID=2692810 RepID=UPI00321F8B28